jgi:hypothetical protein
MHRFISILREASISQKQTNFKASNCVEPSPGLSRNVMHMISSASKNSGVSLMLKWLQLSFSRFTRFRHTRRFEEKLHPYIKAELSVSLKHSMLTDTVIGAIAVL